MTNVPLIDRIKQPSSAAGGVAVMQAIDGLVADGRVTWLRVVQIVLGLYAIIRSEFTPAAAPILEGTRSSNTSVSASVVVSKEESKT